MKHYKIKISKDGFLEFSDAVKVNFYKQEQVVFTMIIRTGLIHAKYMPVICDKKDTCAVLHLSLLKIIN
ncbi:hypothetical protein [Spiroplasma clarkii]|uniref:hypothetical protein n=1 Tax=Spiroplasma clarkii TaxID=2139 RepID=UPI0011BA740A|nr:hypothetical protein [Spiroplasma clarkii]